MWLLCKADWGGVLEDVSQAVGGSWMVSRDMISAGDFEGITRKSREATDLFRELRGCT